MELKQRIKAFAKKFKIARDLWHLYQRFLYRIKHLFSRQEHYKKRKTGAIVQMVSTYAEKDGIGNSVKEIATALQKKGIKNYVVYEGAHSKIKNGVPIPNFRFNKHDIVVFHMGGGCKAAETFKTIAVKKKVMIYHNITPAKYFYDSPNDKKCVVWGRKQIKELRNVTDIAICVSKYNESELKKIGYKKTCVIPVPHRIDELLKYRVDTENSNIKKIITVGRIARHKCIEDVVKTFNEYHCLDNKTHLFIIGGCSNFKYNNELKSLLKKLHLTSCVTFTGPIDDSSLAFYYHNADAYLCMSEHEGFCIPLIEALMFNVPTFAYKCTAIGETLGDYGCLLKDKNYKKNAKIMYEQISNSKLTKDFFQVYNTRYNNKININKMIDYIKK